jgi:hypothetical protein
MEVIKLRKTIDTKAKNFLKQEFPIEVSEFGEIVVSNEVHLKKQQSLLEVSEFEKSNCY